MKTRAPLPDHPPRQEKSAEAASSQRPQPEAIYDNERAAAQRKIGALVGDSTRVARQAKLLGQVQDSGRHIAQRQRAATLSDRPIQARTAASPQTGLPEQLKSGIEALSGMTMDHVKVHYGSPQPAQLNALAYAQGSDIHVAPGQEKHLPHEAWHVVQQAQGRVRPTRQMKPDVSINDDQVVQRTIRVFGRDDLRGQNRIRIWLMQNLNDPGLGILKAYAPAIRALLNDDRVVAVNDSVAGAEELFDYLKDYRYLQPQGGDDAHMVWRRRLVDEILSSNYPLQIAGDLLDQHVYTAGVLSALNRDVGRNTLQIMNYPDVHPRGTTLNALWERRRIAVTERLAASFYDTLKAILAPRPDERVALATLWSGGDDEVLKDLGTSFKTEPRAAAAVDVTSTGLDPADYADGSSGDPIPFLFYKRPSQYPTAIEPKANSHEPALAWNVENTLTLYDGTTAKIGGAGIFNPIQTGRHLQDNSGHGSNRPVEQKIRKSLALNYLLTGLDIDHILDLGFGGADVGKNLWPLNADVNRRPVNGQWRTQYKLHFKAGTQVFLGAIGSTNLYHKHYVIKGYVPGDGANGVPAESGTPAAGKKT